MGLLLGLLTGSVVVSGLVVRSWHRQDQVARLWDRARFKAIEGQMATMRASLRIAATEQAVRQRMHTMHANVFANSTIQEEPEEWRS